VLAAAAVLAQIAYPLLSGSALLAATVAGVVLFAAASVVDAGARWTARAALTLLLVAGGLGLLAEAVGVRTGVPFGSYAYAGTLGPAVLGVPLLVPLAWTMMAYPCLVLARRLASGRARAGSLAGGAGAGRRLRVAVLGGLTLASWDLALDPQMVAAGHWTWAHPEPALPGVPGIPLTNYAGWVLVSLVMVAALDRLLPDGTGGRPDGTGELVPALLLAWTWLGSVIGNLAFFGRPWVAVYVGVAMGAFVAPYLLAVLRGGRR
jgi:putative membrane protein